MDAIAQVTQLLQDAKSALFVTGAGISADSGLPTYRGIGGLYTNGLTEDGIPYEQALSGTMLQRDPELCWRTIGAVEAACRGARHNKGHEVIASLEKRLERVVVLTQNVDGFHRDAGSSDVIEVHGSLRQLKCTTCRWTRSEPDYATLEIPPSCPECGRLVRPDVVLFGEMLPIGPMKRLNALLPHTFDVVVIIGTTAVFPYIAWPVVAARRSGVPTVEINPGTSEVSHLVDHRLSMGAADALEKVWSGLVGRGTPRP